MDAALRLFYLCGSLVLITFIGAQAQGFDLRVERSENAITLTCTDSVTGNPPALDPQFFRGTTGMRVDDQNGFTRTGNVLTFRITRELEDEYSCGTPNVRSNSRPLIGAKRYASTVAIMH